MSTNAPAPSSNSISVDRLRSIIERIERLEVERKALSDDIRDIYTEGKSAGFNPKVLRQVIAIRKRDREEVEAEDLERDTYVRALA